MRRSAASPMCSGEDVRTEVLAGSHIESQNHAGCIDGALGVMYALGAARALRGDRRNRGRLLRPRYRGERRRFPDPDAKLRPDYDVESVLAVRDWLRPPTLDLVSGDAVRLGLALVFRRGAAP
jgi:hypothetical protein